MQTVIHEYRNVHPIFDKLEMLYSKVSSPCKNHIIPDEYDSSFEELCDLLHENVSWFKYPKLSDFDYGQYSGVKEDSTIIVCISGGKDSVALVKLLIEEGYNVHLYHLKGINKVYYDEFIAVQNIAEYLDIPYFIDEVSLSGTQDFTEHPMKNMIIANGAINYAIRENLPLNIAFGNFTDSYLVDNDFNICAGDCMDMWYAYESIVKKVFPDFQLIIKLHNNQETLDIIERNIKLLPLSLSCISPYRFRTHWGERTSKKYHVSLLPNRCGCCWKCAVEYIYFADTGHLDFDIQYYLHCVEILYHTKVKESEIKEWSVIDLWNEYMFYSMADSKAWESLKNATFSNGKIKCIK